MAARVAEHDLGALDVRLDRARRLLEDQPDADGGREVVDPVALLDGVLDERLVGDRVDDDPEAPLLLEVRDVLDAARREVVDHDDASGPARSGARRGAIRRNRRRL